MTTARAHPLSDAPKASISRATPSALRALRPGVSLSSLSRLTGIGRAHLSRIVNGKRGLTVRKARLIAWALEVPLVAVLDALDGPFAAPRLGPNADDARARTSDIKRPKGKRCDDCGGPGPLEKHHADYADPKDFDWLCRKCHTARHGGCFNSRSRKFVATASL